jgi:hypothetical protein
MSCTVSKHHASAKTDLSELNKLGHARVHARHKGRRQRVHERHEERNAARQRRHGMHRRRHFPKSCIEVGVFEVVIRRREAILGNDIARERHVRGRHRQRLSGLLVLLKALEQSRQRAVDDRLRLSDALFGEVFAGRAATQPVQLMVNRCDAGLRVPKDAGSRAVLVAALSARRKDR